MADVKVCDRCGKRLTDERMKFSVKPVTTRYVMKATLFKRSGYRLYGGPDLVNTEHDLCINCATKLAEWMENGETEKTEGNT